MNRDRERKMKRERKVKREEGREQLA